MNSLTLYSYYRSSCSYRVRIALYYKSLDFKYQAVHLIKDGGEQFYESYKALNPLSQVPCLKHEDKVITQSLPILLYLEELNLEPSLLPKKSFEKSQILSFCEMINSTIQPLQNLSVLNYLDKELKQDKLKWTQHWLEKGLQACELFLKPRANLFCFGDTLTLADLFLIPQVYNAYRFGLNVEQFSCITRINQHCLQKEFFKKALPENQPDAQNS